MKIEVCMGSSCHAQGSQGVIEMLKKAIAANGFGDKIELAGSICLGHCAEPGANMKIDGEVVTGITAENFDEFFNTHIKKPLLG